MNQQMHVDSVLLNIQNTVTSAVMEMGNIVRQLATRVEQLEKEKAELQKKSTKQK